MAKAGLLFVGTADGLVLFSNPNNIGRWLKIGQPFRGQAVRAVWALADNPLVVLAAVAGAGLQRSEDGGQSWRSALADEVVSFAGSAAAPGVYLVTQAGEVYRSGDGGASWQRCVRGSWAPSDGARVLAGRADAQSVYVGAADGSVWASEDGGASWRAVGERLPAPIAGLAESPARPGELYAVAGGALHRADAASAWRPVAAPGALSGPVVELAGRAPVLLAALAGGGVGRSEDGGATWALVGEGARIDVLAAVSYHMDSAYAGGPEGTLLASADRGRTWEAVKSGLPPIQSVAVARLV